MFAFHLFDDRYLNIIHHYVFILVFYFKRYKSNIVFTDKISDLGNNRILVTWDYTSVDISIGCSPTNGLPTAVETIVLVKKGMNVYMYLNNDKLAKINMISELDNKQVVR